jgi:hypothetical protein
MYRVNPQFLDAREPRIGFLSKSYCNGQESLKSFQTFPSENASNPEHDDGHVIVMHSRCDIIMSPCQFASIKR